MIQKAFGIACKTYRESKNVSQEKFALSIGMDRTYYASVEEKIADGFEVNVSDLIKLAEEYL